MDFMYFIVFVIVSFSFYHAESFSSFDSLISSQCKARCLSLYPWKLNNSSDSRRARSIVQQIAAQKQSFSKRYTNQTDSGIKWHKVMEMCAKNPNCLQCSMPCEIPTNLLSNCKYLCKNRNPLCIESCNLLTELTEKKNGQCPSGQRQLEYGQKCTDSSKQNQLTHLIKQNTIEQDSNGPVLTECSKDSDCGDIQKCCSLNPECPEQGQICQKPVISDFNLPSIPFNLTITERKKGKTVILSWDCVYNKNKPTIFVVEGKWSINSPDSELEMTKWGYLAQTTNNNWIILRSINRGRWYKFRVAAISKSGSFGYSQPTELFILSSAPKPPTKPQNLTINQIYPNQEDSVNVDLSWLRPKKSDLPIQNYKITWTLRPNLTNDEFFNQNNEEESDEEASDYSHNDHDLTNLAPSGTQLVDSSQYLKTTIKNLNKNSIYSVEIAAISKYDGKNLLGKSSRLRVDTSLLNMVPVSSSLISGKLQDYEEDDDEEEIEKIPDVKSPIITRKSPELSLKSSQKIINLTIETPYYLNGLSKARVSWIIENSEKDEVSITTIERPHVAITWFAIKCFGQDKNLPNPITATTSIPFFEIYELKFNCNYVVNVRLSHNSKPGESKISTQVVSSQFLVPKCSEIEVRGNLKPRCYDKYTDILNGKLENKNRQVTNPIYKLLFTTESTSTTTTSKTTTTTTLSSSTTSKINEYAVNNNYPNLPRIQGIRYRVVEKSVRKNLYSVEFSWSLPLIFNRNLFDGYQLSVAPRQVPIFSDENGFFGSLGAIVKKDQQSFVVREIMPGVKYIFQIQTVGVDNQSLGPISSIEFEVEEKVEDRLNEINRLDYDDANELYLIRSTSSPDYYQYSSADKLTISRSLVT
ncbi:unnamed protein product, partial [Brachionus calyciflorus]